MTEPRIVSDPEVMMGKPVVAGTRVGVDLILEMLGSGEPIEAVLESHPRLSFDDVLAALRYTAEVLLTEIDYSIDA